MIRSILIIISTLLLAAPLMGGCADDVTLDGAGTACVSSSEGWPTTPQSYFQDQPVFVTVRLHECVSASCHTGRYASCTATVEGNRIIIESEGGYTDESSAGASCTSDCLNLDATCQTTSLPMGDYTIVYGSDEISITVPTASPAGVYCVPQP